MEKVLALSHMLFELRHSVVLNDNQAHDVITLIEALPQTDRLRYIFPERPGKVSKTVGLGYKRGSSVSVTAEKIGL